MRPRPGPDPKYRLEAGKIIEPAKNLADATGDSILRATSGVEKLASANSTKHLTKAEVVREMNKGISRSGPEPGG
jgi:hypothetical protein